MRKNSSNAKQSGLSSKAGDKNRSCLYFDFQSIPDGQNKSSPTFFFSFEKLFNSDVLHNREDNRIDFKDR